MKAPMEIEEGINNIESFESHSACVISFIAIMQFIVPQHLV